MATHAAIDVGSNSIRMLIADVDALGRVRRLHADREVVRLGTGVFRAGRLTSESMELAYRVLERMAAAVDHFGVESLRAVGTSALRDSANTSDFLLEASGIIGAPLEVIGGLEEARLVQRGVAAQWPHEHEGVLIIDVGGGSVQLILSQRERFVAGTSLPLGAVRLTEMFLRDDPPRAVDVRRMRAHIRHQIAGASERLVRSGIHRAVATSATAGAVVCAVNRVKRSQRHLADGLGATLQQSAELLELLIDRDVASRAAITGVGRRRAEVIVAGAAVLTGIMEALRLPSIRYSTAGLCDGIVADLACAAAERDPGSSFPVAGPDASNLLQTGNTNVT